MRRANIRRGNNNRTARPNRLSHTVVHCGDTYRRSAENASSHRKRRSYVRNTHTDIRILPHDFGIDGRIRLQRNIFCARRRCNMLSAIRRRDKTVRMRVRYLLLLSNRNARIRALRQFDCGDLRSHRLDIHPRFQNRKIKRRSNTYGQPCSPFVCRIIIECKNGG